MLSVMCSYMHLIQDNLSPTNAKKMSYYNLSVKAALFLFKRIVCLHLYCYFRFTQTFAATSHYRIKSSPFFALSSVKFKVLSFKITVLV